MAYFGPAYFDVMVLYDMKPNGDHREIFEAWLAILNTIRSLLPGSYCHIVKIAPTKYITKVHDGYQELFFDRLPERDTDYHRTDLLLSNYHYDFLLHMHYMSGERMCEKEKYHLGNANGFCRNFGYFDTMYHTVNHMDRNTTNISITGIGYYEKKILFYNTTMNLRVEINLNGEMTWSKPLLLTRNHIVVRVLLDRKLPVRYYGPSDLSRRYLEKWRQFVIRQKRKRIQEEILYSPNLPLWFKNEYQRSKEDFNIHRRQ